MDIYDIPISEITSQYLDYIRSMEEEDLDVMSDFLVMAATLLKIKAKMLLPVKEEEEEEGDPREELVRRLIEYKIYKYASLFFSIRCNRRSNGPSNAFTLISIPINQSLFFNSMHEISGLLNNLNLMEW